MRYGFLRFTKPTGEFLEIEMLLPTGQLGLRHFGHRVVVRIDRTLGVEVLDAVFRSRVILSGGMNAGSMSWCNLPTLESDWEVCRTALEMVEARVEVTAKLFRRGYLDARWLDARARYEVGL